MASVSKLWGKPGLRIARGRQTILISGKGIVVRNRHKEGLNSIGATWDRVSTEMLGKIAGVLCHA